MNKYIITVCNPIIVFPEKILSMLGKDHIICLHKLTYTVGVFFIQSFDKWT